MFLYAGTGVASLDTWQNQPGSLGRSLDPQDRRATLHAHIVWQCWLGMLGPLPGQACSENHGLPLLETFSCMIQQQLTMMLESLSPAKGHVETIYKIPSWSIFFFSSFFLLVHGMWWSQCLVERICIRSYQPSSNDNLSPKSKEATS